MASNRIGRINEEIQRELASLLRNLKDPRVQSTGPSTLLPAPCLPTPMS